jgi:hypothetical protein
MPRPSHPPCFDYPNLKEARETKKKVESNKEEGTVEEDRKRRKRKYCKRKDVYTVPLYSQSR